MPAKVILCVAYVLSWTSVSYFVFITDYFLLCYCFSHRSNVRRMDEIRCPSPSNNIETEKKLKMQKKLQRNTDRPWLNACMGVLNGEPAPVLAYLAAGGNPSRQLTQNEVIALGRPSAFDAGYTLVHLAIRWVTTILQSVLNSIVHFLQILFY